MFHEFELWRIEQKSFFLSTANQADMIIKGYTFNPNRVITLFSISDHPGGSI